MSGRCGQSLDLRTTGSSKAGSIGGWGRFNRTEGMLRDWIRFVCGAWRASSVSSAGLGELRLAPELAPRSGDAILALHQERLV